MNISEIYNKVIESSSTDLKKLDSISQISERENKIPKIVHFCFLDYRNITELHLNYIKTWFEILDDSWTFVNWTPELVSPVCGFEQYMLDNNKFAFYADYIRAARVFEYGGVYMDCDVRVIKSFESLLDCDYVFDNEYNLPSLECGSFLAKKNNKFIKIIKESYEKTDYNDYIKNPGFFLAPKYWVTTLFKKHITVGVSTCSDIQKYKELLSLKKENVLYTLDGTFLSCPCIKSKSTGIVNTIRENTFTSHGFENTWRY